MYVTHLCIGDLEPGQLLLREEEEEEGDGEEEEEGSVQITMVCVVEKVTTVKLAYLDLLKVT